MDKTLQVLVVDDEEPILDLVRSTLESPDCRVDAVTNCRDALAKVRNAAYDLVILDLLLPDMNGFVLSQEIVSRILDFSARYALERRNYNEHFNERDSNSTVYVLSADIYPTKHNVFRIRPYYAHEKRTSRGDIAVSPLVDDDVGFDSDLAGMELRGMWGSDPEHRRTVTVYYENEKRDFTSSNATDPGHFGREDDITQYRLGYEHELNGQWQLRFAYRYRNNDSSTPSPLGGTSTTALSVSTSATPWCSETRSPSRTSHFLSSASVIPSPRSGSLKS